MVHFLSMLKSHHKSETFPKSGFNLYNIYFKVLKLTLALKWTK